MFPQVPFFLPRLHNVYELPFFFQPRCLGINQITRESFSPQSLSQKNYFNMMLFWMFWCFCGLSAHFLDLMTLNPKRAVLFGPVQAEGGGIHPHFFFQSYIAIFPLDHSEMVLNEIQQPQIPKKILGSLEHLTIVLLLA